MTSTVAERIELAKLCSSKDWSKAIRLLDSLLAQSCVIQDICNRAFCYSKLELHKHVIKDCDKALKLDPTLLQAYILKGCAFSALGRKDEAVQVWEQGYDHALHQSADLKQLLELEELLSFAKQGNSIGSRNHVLESSGSSNGANGSVPSVSIKMSKTTDNYTSSNNESAPSINSSERFEISDESNDKSGLSNGLSSAIMESPKTDSHSNGIHKNQPNGSCDIKHKLVDQSVLNGKSKDTSQSHKSSTVNGGSSDIKHKLVDQSALNDKSKDTSQSHNKPSTVNGGSSDIKHKLVHQSVLNGKSKGKSQSHNKSFTVNGESSRIKHKLVDQSVLKGKSKDTSQSHDKSSTVNGESSDTPDSDKFEWSDALKKSTKYCVTKVSKAKSMNVDFRLSRGIAQVNEGKYNHAISIFDQILQEDSTYPEALIGRGTAYAFQRELDSAIADFTKAIQSNPSAGEAWKRRGQARAALGESAEAIADLTKALEFEPDSPDILHERGIVNFKFKDFTAAVKDLSACVKMDKSNKSAYTYLGLSLSSLGEYRRAEDAHKRAIQLDQSFLEAWAHMAQFYQDLANSEKALKCLQKVLEIDARFAKAYHLRGLLLHGMGNHKNAIKELSTGLSLESSNIECLYLRASCYHAIGEYKEAVKDYDAALDLELDSMEKFVLQCLAFYQKEIALYTASKINSEFSWFDIDGLDPLFKEYWCKRLHPKNVCEKVYRQPPLRDSLRKAKLKKLDFAFTKQKTVLLLAADSIGGKIQYNCPGFLANRRQHRMAGLAAIEIAQKVSKFWRTLQAEWKHSGKGTAKSGRKIRRKDKLNPPSHNRGGAGCSTSSFSETSTSYSSLEDRPSGRSGMSWHDVYNLAVKWRQISEPCDPVVWVNKLSEEFNAGFGSHTPLVLGQAKVVRYFRNFQRTLNAAKVVIKDRKYVCDKKDNIINLSEEGKLQEIMNAESLSDLYKAVGEDFWVATWCNSTAVEGMRLEGTRITLLKMGENGFDFAIRTPCTPSRWEDFDAEMTAAWEALCDAYSGETFGSTNFDVLENVRDAILRMTYYWYNFMPLSRGSAAVGFVVLLGLLLAANMEFTGSIPQDLQVDWEAILNFDLNSFADTVKSWLYPSLKATTSWKGYPDVGSTLETTGSVIAALSNYSD